MNKYILIILLISFSFASIGQNLPKMKLRENKSISIPDKIATNEIAVVLEQFGGWSAYNNLTYYIFKNSGEIIAYKKQTLKSYLRKKNRINETLSEIELTAKKKEKFRKNIQSDFTINFQKYSQDSFKKNTNTIVQCKIIDAVGYKITFLQNGKQNSYKYYAPYYSLEKCNDKNIDKNVLTKFLQLIEMWEHKKK